jgi:hypothetical protein
MEPLGEYLVMVCEKAKNDQLDVASICRSQPQTLTSTVEPIEPKRASFA